MSLVYNFSATGVEFLTHQKNHNASTQVVTRLPKGKKKLCMRQTFQRSHFVGDKTMQYVHNMKQHAAKHLFSQNAFNVDVLSVC